MEISLPIDVEQVIHEKLLAGQYASTDEIVCAGIRLLMERDELFNSRRTDWESLIEEGIRQADAGDVIEGDEFLKSLE